MPIPGPPINVTRAHTRKGEDGGKILTVSSEAKTFPDTLKSEILRLESVLFFMHNDQVTAHDSGIIVRLCQGADPDQVEGVIRQLIATHHGWELSDADVSSEETFWRGVAPIH